MDKIDHLMAEKNKNKKRQPKGASHTKKIFKKKTIFKQFSNSFSKRSEVVRDAMKFYINKACQWLISPTFYELIWANILVPKTVQT
jgi:hypothetical protein